MTAAKRAGATVLIRGLRDGTDFDYEMQMAGMNGAMAPDVQTVFLPASPAVRPITATLVRQIAGMGGDVSAFVPAPVAARLKKKFAGKARQLTASEERSGAYHAFAHYARRCRRLALAAPAFASRRASPIPRRCASRRRPSYKARFDTTQGRVRDRGATATGRPTAPTASTIWCKNGFYDNVPFLPRDLGLHGAVRHQRRSENFSGTWRDAQIKDDPVKQSNKRGYHHLRDGRRRTRAPARCSSTSATTRSLDSQGFSPFGQVVSGMNVVDKLNAEYGEGAPRGRGPDQGRIQMEGNAYLAKDFGKLDFVKKATIEK